MSDYIGTTTERTKWHGIYIQEDTFTNGSDFWLVETASSSDKHFVGRRPTDSEIRRFVDSVS